MPPLYNNTVSRIPTRFLRGRMGRHIGPTFTLYGF